MTPAAEPRAGATFDASGRFRYLLWRTWDECLPRACFIMLNPSTANAERDDPTIRRCIGFGRSHGFGGIDVVNLFALRATEPALLPRTDFARGPANADYVRRVIERSWITIAAWGVHGAGHWRALSVLSEVELHCLGVTNSGEPRHPLYVHGSARLRRWTPPRATEMS